MIKTALHPQPHTTLRRTTRPSHDLHYMHYITHRHRHITSPPPTHAGTTPPLGQPAAQPTHRALRRGWLLFSAASHNHHERESEDNCTWWLGYTPTLPPQRRKHVDDVRKGRGAKSIHNSSQPQHVKTAHQTRTILPYTHTPASQQHHSLHHPPPSDPPLCRSTHPPPLLALARHSRSSSSSLFSRKRSFEKRQSTKGVALR